MPVHIETTRSELDIPRAMIRQSALRVLRGEGNPGARLTVIIVDDPYIRRLNQTYRHVDRATDVLSFGMGEPDEGTGRLLGEVYLSIDRAREQAIRFEVSLDDELRRLTVHGCLHLLGYDHHRTADRMIMRQKEALYSGTPRSENPS